ncbi:hypothetical protein C7S17_4341 [Burkholderia thailandensis]|nr:hypothetical protein [Burkholderia thailandensis]
MKPRGRSFAQLEGVAEPGAAPGPQLAASRSAPNDARCGHSQRITAIRKRI